MPSDRDMSLPAMARALAALLRAIDVVPVVVAGHSAGAAVLVRMALDGRIEPRVLISLNGALLPFRGFMAKAFAPAARLLARLPLVPPLFAALAGDDAAVARLLRDTGSTIDAQGLRLYSRLVRNPAHVAGALAMMAQWDLAALERDLPALTTRLLLVVGRNDRTVPAADAYRVRSRVQRATIVAMPGLGHLAHEERPELAAALIAEALTEVPA
jgi:magnesium chelatase accessory protein